MSGRYTVYKTIYDSYDTVWSITGTGMSHHLLCYNLLVYLFISTYLPLFLSYDTLVLPPPCIESALSLLIFPNVFRRDIFPVNLTPDTSIGPFLFSCILHLPCRDVPETRTFVELDESPYLSSSNTDVVPRKCDLSNKRYSLFRLK